MASGFFIGIGDKTGCGGKVLQGDALVTIFGIHHAREGDPVTCGKDGSVHRILGGIPFIQSNGRSVAGNLDSISGCPCRATLYPSRGVPGYQSRNSVPPGVRSAAPAVAAAVVPSPAAETSRRTYVPSFAQLTGEEPGFYIVPKSVSRGELMARMLTRTTHASLSKFHSLNPGPELIKAGSIIVLSDPDNHQCTREEAKLMTVASSANKVLESMSTQEADFMMQHRDEIATFLGYGSTGVGIGEVMFARHLSLLSELLKDLEKLHQSTFVRDGHLRSPAFFTDRKRLLGQIDQQLTSLTRKGIGLADHPELKHVLGISSRSLVHHWSKAGIPGQIPGYATHLDGIAKASKFIKAGGWIGMGLGAGSSALKVQQVCAAGNTEQCERVKFTEAGSFIVGTAGGAIAGGILSAKAAGICVGLGVASGGLALLGCGIIIVGGGSLAIGYGGEILGSAIGEKIYETTR